MIDTAILGVFGWWTASRLGALTPSAATTVWIVEQALSSDHWTTTDQIGERLGVSSESARSLTLSAWQRGAAIVCHPTRGYRLAQPNEVKP